MYRKLLRNWFSPYWFFQFLCKCGETCRKYPKKRWHSPAGEAPASGLFCACMPPFLPALHEKGKKPAMAGTSPWGSQVCCTWIAKPVQPVRQRWNAPSTVETPVKPKLHVRNGNTMRWQAIGFPQLSLPCMAHLITWTFCKDKRSPRTYSQVMILPTMLLILILPLHTKPHEYSNLQQLCNSSTKCIKTIKKLSKEEEETEWREAATRLGGWDVKPVLLLWTNAGREWSVGPQCKKEVPAGGSKEENLSQPQLS